ncbi:interferon regulatory factor 1-like [Paramuricea clavata]|uniref:Interferon regulatory factor 1-like n=1 Tax=Paramuricea clavata TaxID=317549 RepID=A0A6S7G035_PARCT|nr:interferon regulatory factor 1-like [Paramuricea clavata]
MTEKLQLRDWLFTLLEHNQTPGLEWLDRDQKIFSISWRHGRKKGWKSENDSQLFKEWAIYKKRYKPGNDRKNAKLWKSRFRCALNALNDVRELKTLSKTKGEDPKKIYQFLQKQPVVTVKRRRFPKEEPRFAEFDFNEEHCCNKIDTRQVNLILFIPRSIL